MPQDVAVCMSPAAPESLGRANGGAETRRAVINRYGSRAWRWILKAGFFARRPTLARSSIVPEIAWPIHTDRRFF
jgi:hypothetical protein